MSEKIYQFNEYVLGYDKGENDRSCLVISKYLLDKVYVMAELYDGSAEIISTILDSLQQENKQLKEEIEEQKKYNIELMLCNSGFNAILTELEEWLKETRINSAFIDEETIMEVQLKIQELKEKYKC